MKPTATGAYHSLGATYPPEHKLVKVLFPALVVTPDVTRPNTPIIPEGPRLESKPETPENIPLEKKPLQSLGPSRDRPKGEESGSFAPISLASSQSSEAGSLLSLSSALSSPTQSVRGSAEEALSEQSYVTRESEYIPRFPIEPLEPVAASTSGFHYRLAQPDSVDAETIIE